MTDKPHECCEPGCHSIVRKRDALRCKSCAAKERQRLQLPETYVRIDTDKLLRLIDELLVNAKGGADNLKSSWQTDQMPTRTLHDLCTDADTDYTKVQRWRHGQARADVYALDQFAAKGLGVHVDSLIAKEMSA